MKIVAKPIDVIACFDRNGSIQPIRFRLENEDDSVQIIKINKIIKITQEKLAGNVMELFVCNTIINGLEKIVELKYELDSHKWILFKY